MFPVLLSPIAFASAGGLYENNGRTTLGRDLVDRSRILVHAMLDNPDEIGPNFVILLILAEQLQRLHDAFEEDEVRRLRDEKLPQ